MKSNVDGLMFSSAGVKLMINLTRSKFIYEMTQKDVLPQVFVNWYNSLIK